MIDEESKPYKDYLVIQIYENKKDLESSESEPVCEDILFAEEIKKRVEAVKDILGKCAIDKIKDLPGYDDTDIKIETPEDLIKYIQQQRGLN
jgi:hypothetical protein